MAAAKPSLALLREMSDATVIGALMDSARLTRAELAVVTGLSKPTVGESIRRLSAAGLVRDTGQRTTGRGGVGTYFALSEDAGIALAVGIAPEGVTVEALEPSGTLIEHVLEPLRRPATPRAVTDALVRATRAAVGERRARVAAVSAADPVDKATGELVQLPDAPFLVGAMSPAAALAPLVDGAVIVDNDVNWAARAEHAVRFDQGSAADDFVYLYLGEGIGCAVITDGQVRRGHHGLAGEIAHLSVAGPHGQAMPLITALGELGLQHPNSTAVDVDGLLATLDSAAGAVLARALAHAIAGALDAAVAFTDPAFVVLAGAWARAEAFVAELDDVVAQRPRRIALSQPRVHDNPPLEGARAAALSQLRSDLIARSR